LFTLGILAVGAITVNDGTNTTTYKSTGSDTVGDLLNAINTNAHGNAQVTAWLDSTGKLVVTANKQTSTISIGGAFAPNVGFGASNDLFQPTAAAPAPTSGGSGSSPASSSSGTSSSASTPTSSSSSSASGSSASAAATLLRNSALALQSSGTAEVLLASSGLSGSSIVNLLA
jgi:hypothetical protein